jgi:hypothetical protein
VELTPDDVGDVSALPDLLDQIEDPVGSMTADGAYDTVTQFMMRCCSDVLQRA